MAELADRGHKLQERAVDSWVLQPRSEGPETLESRVPSPLSSCMVPQWRDSVAPAWTICGSRPEEPRWNHSKPQFRVKREWVGASGRLASRECSGRGGELVALSGSIRSEVLTVAFTACRRRQGDGACAAAPQLPHDGDGPPEVQRGVPGEGGGDEQRQQEQGRAAFDENMHLDVHAPMQRSMSLRRNSNPNVHGQDEQHHENFQ